MKKTSNTHWLVIAWLLITLHHSLFTATALAEEASDPLHSFLEELDTLKSDFTQTLIGTNGNVLEEAAGVLVMQSPGKFYWSYESPYVQKIITDGRTLWIYDEDLEQVTIKDVSESINDSPAAILSGSENLERHYLVENQGEIEGLNMFELNPVDSENQFEKIYIGFLGKQLFLMVMYDNLGQTTRINFKNPQRNVVVDADRFDFLPPDGVDVIDDRPGTATP